MDYEYFVSDVKCQRPIKSIKNHCNIHDFLLNHCDIANNWVLLYITVILVFSLGEEIKRLLDIVGLGRVRSSD